MPEGRQSRAGGNPGRYDCGSRAASPSEQDRAANSQIEKQLSAGWFASRRQAQNRCTGRQGGMECFRATLTAALLGLLCGSSAAFSAQLFDIRLEAAYTYDDNVTRSEGAGNVLSDRFFTATVSGAHAVTLTDRSRFALEVFVGGDWYDRHDGLSRYFAGAQGELQFRPSGEFDAPTFGLFLRVLKDQYDSELRDGYRYSAGIRVLKPVTDRIELFAAAAYNKRDGKSAVFDTDDYSARVNFDYAVTRWSTLYLGAEYRKGDVVSTARPSLDLITLAEAVVRDDAFTDTERLAYRIKASTVLATLGYNLAFGEKHSLDFSWRWAHARAHDELNFGAGDKPEYKVNQYSVAYLLRF